MGEVTILVCSVGVFCIAAYEKFGNEIAASIGFAGTEVGGLEEYVSQNGGNDGVDLDIEGAGGDGDSTPVGPLDPQKVAQALAKDGSQTVVVDGVELTVAELKELIDQGLIDPNTLVNEGATTAALLAQECAESGQCEGADTGQSAPGGDGSTFRIVLDGVEVELTRDELIEALEKGEWGGTRIRDGMMVTAVDEDGNETSMSVGDLKGRDSLEIEEVALRFDVPGEGSEDGTDLILVTTEDGVETFTSMEAAANYVADNRDKITSVQRRVGGGEYEDLTGRFIDSGDDTELATTVETQAGVTLKGGKEVDSHTLAKNLSENEDGAEMVVAELDDEGKVIPGQEQRVAVRNGELVYLNDDGSLMTDDNGDPVRVPLANIDENPNKTLALRCEEGEELCDVDEVAFGFGLDDAKAEKQAQTVAARGDDDDQTSDTQTALDPEYEKYARLGDISRKEESGGDPAAVNENDLGGCPSYGPNQLTSCDGGDSSYMYGNVGRYGETYPELFAACGLDSHTPGSKQFTSSWKTCANSTLNPGDEGYAALHAALEDHPAYNEFTSDTGAIDVGAAIKVTSHDWIVDTHYKVLVNNIEQSTGLDVDEMSLGMRESVYSASVQLGSSIGNSAYRDALGTVLGVNARNRDELDAALAQVDTTDPDFQKAWIMEAYRERGTKFPSSPLKVQRSIGKRMVREGTQMVSLVDSPHMPSPPRNGYPAGVAVASGGDTGSTRSASVSSEGAGGSTRTASLDDTTSAATAGPNHRPSPRPGVSTVASNDTDSTEERTPIVIKRTLATSDSSASTGTFNDSVTRVPRSEAAGEPYPLAEPRGEEGGRDTVVSEGADYILTRRTVSRDEPDLDDPGNGGTNGGYASSYKLDGADPAGPADDPDSVIAGVGGVGGAIGRSLRQGSREDNGTGAVYINSAGAAAGSAATATSEAGANDDQGGRQSARDFENAYRRERGLDPLPDEETGGTDRRAGVGVFGELRRDPRDGAESPPPDQGSVNDGGGGGFRGWVSNLWSNRETGDRMFTDMNESGRETNAQHRRVEQIRERRQEERRREEAGTGGSSTRRAPNSGGAGGAGGMFGALGRLLGGGSSSSGGDRQPPQDSVTEATYTRPSHGPGDDNSAPPAQTDSGSSGSFWSDTWVGRGLSRMFGGGGNREPRAQGPYVGVHPEGNERNEAYQRGLAHQRKHQEDGSFRPPRRSEVVGGGQSGGGNFLSATWQRIQSAWRNRTAPTFRGSHDERQTEAYRTYWRNRARQRREQRQHAAPPAAPQRRQPGPEPLPEEQSGDILEI